MASAPEGDKPPLDQLKPHKGELMMILGIVSLIVGPPVVSPLVWYMAHNNLKEMDAGLMDPAGRSQSQTARLLAMISTIVWPVIMCCCCCGMAGTQFISGGRFVSAIGSRRITRQEYQRVQMGMTKQQVRDILGPPARTEIEEFHHRWHYDEKNGRARFEVDFTVEGRVQGVASFTPD